jgi:hypothetical protein
VEHVVVITELMRGSSASNTDTSSTTLDSSLPPGPRVPDKVWVAWPTALNGIPSVTAKIASAKLGASTGLDAPASCFRNAQKNGLLR